MALQEPVRNKGKIEVDGKMLTPAQLKDRYTKTARELKNYKESVHCVVCNRRKADSNFYEARNTVYKSGWIPVCKECIQAIAHRIDRNGELHEPTRQSLVLALAYINKPFYRELYEQCLSDAEMGYQTTDFAKLYITKITSNKYAGKTFADSDFMTNSSPVILEEGELSGSEREQMASDRMEVIGIVGYDPFVREDPADKPFLYSSLIRMIDDAGDDEPDVIKLRSCISIVRSFLQIQKLDNTLAGIMYDPDKITQAQNSKIISDIVSAKSSINAGLTKLANENGLTDKGNKTAAKGDGTWTKKLRTIRDLDLRDGQINGYDLATCKGMRQALDESHASIMKTLRLEEGELGEMLAEARDKRIEAQRERDEYKEAFRLILRENLDLKQLLEENGISINEKDLINLSEMVEQFKKDDDS